MAGKNTQRSTSNAPRHKPNDVLRYYLRGLEHFFLSVLVILSRITEFSVLMLRHTHKATLFCFMLGF